MVDVSDLFRVYWDPDEIGYDGYPHAWHHEVRTPDEWTNEPAFEGLVRNVGNKLVAPAIKDLVREQAGHRCIRCGHPFVVGETPGRWSPCNEQCTHAGPVQFDDLVYPEGGLPHGDVPEPQRYAEWRILTVHHLNGVKHDCRWWNLAALCQRCHLTIQAKVHMERAWQREHSDWFKPYVAGFYAWRFLGEEITRDEATSRLDELLALEHVQMELT